MNNKFDVFKTELAHQDYPDLVFVAETWFKETSLMQMYQYDLYKVTRDSNLGGSAEGSGETKKKRREEAEWLYIQKKS